MPHELLVVATVHVLLPFLVAEALTRTWAHPRNATGTRPAPLRCAFQYARSAVPRSETSRTFDSAAT